MIDIIVVGPEEEKWFRGFLLPDTPAVGADQLLLGAVDRDTHTAVGALLATVKRPEMQLEQICVADQWRRRRVGTRLVRAAVRAGYGVVNQITAVEIRGGCSALLTSCGFNLTQLGHSYHFTLSQLDGSEFWNRTPEGRIYQLGDIPAASLNGLNTRLEQLDGQVPDLPVRPEDYHRELSLCTVDKDGEVTALLLVTRQTGLLSLDYLYAAPRHVAELVSLLLTAAHWARANEAPDTLVSLTAVNDTADRLAEKLLPKVGHDELYLCVYKINEEVTDRG